MLYVAVIVVLLALLCWFLFWLRSSCFWSYLSSLFGSVHLGASESSLRQGKRKKALLNKKWTRRRRVYFQQEKCTFVGGGINIIYSMFHWEN
jgi:hypothetical protein